MAITTGAQTSSTWQERIAALIMAEARPKNVLSQHVNTYFVPPKKGSIKLNRWNDPGRAGSGTEGTRYTQTTQLGTSGVELTPSEFAIQQALLSHTMVRKTFGLENVAQLMADGSTDQKVQAIFPIARMLAASCYEALEYDLAELFTGLSTNTVTDSGNAITVSDAYEAIQKLEDTDGLPHEDMAFMLVSEHVAQMRTSARSETGTPFSPDLATILRVRPDLEGMPGLKGVIAGVPVYSLNSSVAQTANSGADYVSALILRGEGDPEESGRGKPGTFAFAYETATPVIGVENDQRERGAEVQALWRGAVGERIDAWGVKLTFDFG